MFRTSLIWLIAMQTVTMFTSCWTRSIYSAFSTSVNGEPTRVSHLFVKKNMIRFMRPHGRFAHCSCENAALILSLGLSTSTAGLCCIPTRSARSACFGLLYRNILLFYLKCFPIDSFVNIATGFATTHIVQNIAETC